MRPVNAPPECETHGRASEVSDEGAKVASAKETMRAYVEAPEVSDGKAKVASVKKSMRAYAKPTYSGFRDHLRGEATGYSRATFAGDSGDSRDTTTEESVENIGASKLLRSRFL